jgi:hypothetical protein
MAWRDEIDDLAERKGMDNVRHCRNGPVLERRMHPALYSGDRGRLARLKLASILRWKIEVCLKEVYELAADGLLVRPGNGDRNLSPLFKRQGEELQNRAEARFAVRRRQADLAGVVSNMADNDLRGTKVNAMCVLNERPPLPHYFTLTSLCN